MNKPKCPCVQDCPNRSTYCKSECEKYKVWEKQYAEYRSEKDAQRDAAYVYYDYKNKIMDAKLREQHRKARNK